MKKIIAAIATVAIAAICATPATANDFDTYSSGAIVYGVTGETVIVCDNNGDIWEFYGEGYHVGDIISMTMGDAGTPDYIYDDTIEEAHII